MMHEALPQTWSRILLNATCTDQLTNLAVYICRSMIYITQPDTVNSFYL